MERTTGIEPASSAWEADILPMNYVRSFSNIIQRCGQKFNRYFQALCIIGN